MSSRDALYDFINPIGCIGVIIFNLILSSVFLLSFRDLNATKKVQKLTQLQILSIVICLWYSLYLFSIVFSRWVIDITNCPIRIMLAGTLYVVSRGILYYFFFVRLVAAFEGSLYAPNVLTVKCLRIFIMLFYSLWTLMFIITMKMNSFDEQRRVCMPTSGIVYAYSYGGALVDFFLGVYLCAAFAWKLKKLQDSIDSVEDQHSATKVNFVKVAKKQIKLSFVAWITSMIFTYGKSALGAISAPWVDALVNVLCVYCSFNFVNAQKTWRYCCECGGNKWCLLLFCFCCTCCNEPGCWCCGRRGAASFKPGLEKVGSTDNDAMSSATENNASSAVDIVSADTTTNTTEQTVDTTTTKTNTDVITATVPSNTATI